MTQIIFSLILSPFLVECLIKRELRHFGIDYEKRETKKGLEIYYLKNVIKGPLFRVYELAMIARRIVYQKSSSQAQEFMGDNPAPGSCYYACFRLQRSFVYFLRPFYCGDFCRCSQMYFFILKKRALRNVNLVKADKKNHFLVVFPRKLAKHRINELRLDIFLLWANKCLLNFPTSNCEETFDSFKR